MRVKRLHAANLSYDAHVGTTGTFGTGNHQFDGPFDVALSPDGAYFFVSEYWNNRVKKHSATGAMAYADKWGSTGSGDGQFNNPTGIAVDRVSGAIYVSENGNDRFQKFDSSGGFVYAVGSAGNVKPIFCFRAV